MSERSSGLYFLLRSPWIYELLQHFSGGLKGFAKKFIRPFPGCRVLDIGCGTANILKYLPDTDYHGFDANTAYIAMAKRKYGSSGNFHCSLVDDAKNLPGEFNVVLALGVLHHLDDLQASALFKLAYEALVPGGRLVTHDEVFYTGQKFWDSLLAKLDRGKNVRTPEAYLGLARSVFANCNGKIEHFTITPNTHWVMECVK